MVRRAVLGQQVRAEVGRGTAQHGVRVVAAGRVVVLDQQIRRPGSGSSAAPRAVRPGPREPELLQPGSVVGQIRPAAGPGRPRRAGPAAHRPAGSATSPGRRRGTAATQAATDRCAMSGGGTSATTASDRSVGDSAASSANATSSSGRERPRHGVRAIGDAGRVGAEEHRRGRDPPPATVIDTDRWCPSNRQRPRVAEPGVAEDRHPVVVEVPTPGASLRTVQHLFQRHDRQRLGVRVRAEPGGQQAGTPPSAPAPRASARDTPGRVRGRYSIQRRPASSNGKGSGGPTSARNSPAAAVIDSARPPAECRR